MQARGGKPELMAIAGGRDPDRPPARIAMSLVVHERKRLDIPVSGVAGVAAFETERYLGAYGPVSYCLPYVRVWLAPAMQERLRVFTRDIVDETVEILVGERCVLRPKLHEPLGAVPSFQIGVADFAEAQALARTLRTGWRPVRVVG